MKTLLTLDQLFDFSQVGRVLIRDSWYGRSAHAPVGALYELVMDAQSRLVGRGYLSTNLIPHRVIQISIASKHASAFLASLGSARLSKMSYTPFVDHTDDFPALGIELWSRASPRDAAPDISLHTESQGEFHAPWEAVVGGVKHTLPGREVGAALVAMASALGAGDRRRLWKDSETLLEQIRSSSRSPVQRSFSEAAVRRAHCWFGVDRVSGDEATTKWKRLARFRQAQWRAANKLREGFHPYAGGKKAKRVGSRIQLDHARDSAANFLSAGALAAVHARLEAPEKHQMLSEDRLWADLLSSMPLCFNMFGSLVWNQAAARRMVQHRWPDVPSGHVRVRFEHSPGRCDPQFLGNKTAFDVVFEVEGEGGVVALGVEVKYHEHAAREARPKPAALQRYIEVAERSNVFKAGWQAQVIGTELQQLWLDHLLVLSMIQHPSGRWSGGKFVLVYPAENPSFHAAAARYREVLRDTTTFDSRTLEDMIRCLPNEYALKERYL